MRLPTHSLTRRAITAAVVALAIAGCSDAPVVAPTAISSVENSAPVSMQSAPFGWLAPLGNAAADPATFDATAVNRVEVCTWIAGACSGVPVAAFAIAPVAGELPLVANNTVGRYEATLNLLNTKFVTRRTYRIRALKGTTEIGFILVDLVRGRWALTRADGTLAPLVAANDLPIRFHVGVLPPPPIKINEIESNGGIPGDWVELYNTGSATIDVSGFVFKDNNDANSYTIPNGTTIAAGAHLVLDESQFTFGIGANDAARLFDASGNLIDSYAFTAHAATTYGRCPNGTGAFKVTSSPTKGTANDCNAPRTVAINEVESSGGVPGDWAELVNYGALPVDLSGFVFKDSDDTQIYTIPAGTTLAPGAFLVIEESSLGFGLGSADQARLFDSGGALVDSYAWTAHASTTYGRCPDGTGTFRTTTSSTKGLPNDCTATSVVKINEVESNGGVPGDWVELYNSSASAVNVSGFQVIDNDDTHARYTIPAGTILAAGAHLVVEESDLGFGLGAADNIRLYDANSSLVETYAWTSHAATTYGRCPNGTGPFVTTTSSTKGSANDCSVPNFVKINEVESSGGVPGDWVELYNPGGVAVNLSGFQVLDSDDTHTRYTIPAGTMLAAGAYLVVEEASLGFGLGAADNVRLYDANGTLQETYAWTAHATTTYGRCPNGTGPFITTTSSTKGAANDCSTPSVVKINEVESSGGQPGDWVELFNSSASAVDVSGFKVIDNDDTHTPYTIPAGTILAAGAYLVVEESNLGFGLGGADNVRLFNASNSIVETYAWTAHAATTYGRCPNGTGPFVTTNTSTKGSANDCGAPQGPVVNPWPGSDNVTTADGQNVFGGNLSGLVFEAAVGQSPDVLWAARNGPGSIFRLTLNGTIWTPDASNNWGAGKLLRFTDGTGEPDTEDLTYTTGSSAGMYIVSERNNQASSISRPSILRYDVSSSNTTLTATNEWLLTADLPPVAANSGLEAITWVPDSYLVAQGFYDANLSKVYNPADYANHGGGLFFVGLEGNGIVYVYALNHVTNGFQRIASFSTGFPSGVMALQFDRELGQLWAICDDTCGGLSNIYVIDVTPASPTLGRMKLTNVFARPSTMPNLNNEGFAFGPQASCVSGLKPVFWSDDSETGGHSIRKASIPCVKFP